MPDTGPGMGPDSAPGTDRDDGLRSFVESFCRFETTDGNEKPAQEWLRTQLETLGFDTYTWEGDPAALADHPSFPDDPAEIETTDRPSVAGVLAVGDPDAGQTLILNGHTDVVPADRSLWSGDPFEPRWTERDGEEYLVARGAADMKAGVGTCVFAALDARERLRAAGLDGRLVVESVVGEEAGGVGAAAAALSNPYPFERDAAIIAEPTDLTPITATAGTLMARLQLRGRSAHAATRWHGEDVLPHFERVRAAFRRLEQERAEGVTHPLYDHPVPWPVVCGRVEAGSWAATVPGSLTSEWRIGVAPGETVDGVETVFRERLAEVTANDDWLRDNPPTFGRFSVQFEPAEIAVDEPVVEALQQGMDAAGIRTRDPTGATYGTDARHYIEVGIPTVVFGPGEIQQAHFPDEEIRWSDVKDARAVLTQAAIAYLHDE